MDQRQRLRLKLPDGSEFEAEGAPEFIREERAQFLKSPNMGLTMAQAAHRTGQELALAWETIIERKAHNIHLRAKLPGDKTQKDACLVLLAASQKLLNQPKPTAAQLAKWLRVSGYPVRRMDRALQESIAQGELLSSGSRRARRYELTGPGRIRAFLLAHQLAATINGPA